MQTLRFAQGDSEGLSMTANFSHLLLQGGEGFSRSKFSPQIAVCRV